MSPCAIQFYFCTYYKCVCIQSLLKLVHKEGWENKCPGEHCSCFILNIMLCSLIKEENIKIQRLQKEYVTANRYIKD